MPELTRHETGGARCDATDCTAEVRWPWGSSFQFFDRLREHPGWSVWVSRGRRVYCPQHGPRPGHKMRQVV